MTSIVAIVNIIIIILLIISNDIIDIIDFWMLAINNFDWFYMLWNWRNGFGDDGRNILRVCRCVSGFDGSGYDGGPW